MHRFRILLSLVAGSLSLCAAGAGHAQTPERVGSFWLERRTDLITDQDRSYAGVNAESDGQPLSLIWACFGDYLGIGFSLAPGYSGYGYESEMRAVWRFDRGEPESVMLARQSVTEPVFMVPEDYRHTFTGRIRGASRLVLRVTSFSTMPTDYVFDLAGSERALGSLGCVRGLRPPDDPPGVLGRPADEAVAEPILPLNTRADTLRMFDHYTPERMRGQRGEVAVQTWVTADGRPSLERMQVTRTAHADFSTPAMFIVSQLSFPPGRARRVTVYVYFSPTGGHVQVEDPG